jgi:hypothetical protein
MLRPLPAGLIGRPANRHPTQRDQLELSQLEFADLIRRLEALEDDVQLHG